VFFAICGGVAGVASLALGITVWIWASRDLVEIQQGLRDIEGEGETVMAKHSAGAAIFATIVLIVLWGSLLLVSAHSRELARMLVEGGYDR
jgi:hypothetical protein